jgi:plastocyanin
MNRRFSLETVRQVMPLLMLGCGALLAGCDDDGGGSGGGGDTAPPAPAVTFSAPSPSTVAPGGQFTLAWSSNSGVSTCTASGGSGSDGWNGSKPATGSARLTASSTPGTYHYTLSCAGSSSGDTATATAAEVVSNPAAPSAPVFTSALVASPSTVAPGTTIVLSWSASGATACAASGAWSGAEPTSSPSGGVGVTAPSMPGSYAYVLTCSGAGGSTAQSASVTVSGGAPQPPVFSSAFTASPASVPTGSNITLTWAATGASSCAASGAWSGSEPTASPAGGVVLTAPSMPGSYTYVLTCSGAGGSTAQSASVSVTGTTPTPPVFGTAFSATPSTVTAGDTISLKWAVSGATACSASGGSAGDGWSGSQPTASPTGGVTIRTSLTPGSYTYALSCSGAGGSTAQTATVTVGSGATGPVFGTALTAAPATVAAGGSFLMSWATSGASACAASGGDGGASWSGAEPTTSPGGGVRVTAPTAPGTYAYVLTCSGSGGSTTQVVDVVVGAFDCAVPAIPTQALLAPHAGVVTATGGALCLICSVDQPGNVVDADPLNHAAILTQVGLLSASESLVVTGDRVFPAGRVAGFVIANPTQLLTLDLLQSLTVSTYLHGALQETGGATDPLRLDLVQLGLVGTTRPAYLGFHTSKAFDAVAITDGPVAGVLGEVDVYHACVSLQ